MILEILIIFSILGMCSAFISYFIDFCFGEGNIFEKYYLFLLTYVEPKSKWLFKILGGCNICLNFWISLFIFSKQRAIKYNRMFYHWFIYCKQ